MARKNAKGSGTIRKKAVTRSGKEYTYWEARITTGRDPGTGKQIQRSFTGKTQKEVREKMQAAAVEVNQGTYTAPQRMTVGQWLDVWASDYLGAVKLSTVRNYRDLIRLHIKPALGAVRLQDIHAHTVQNFINGIDRASATVRLICGVLSAALEKAVELGHFITVALFTGMRMSELLGLTWDCVDYNSGTIAVNKQLAPPAQRNAGEVFTTPKSHKPRTVAAAPSVLAALKAQRRRQIENQLRAGDDVKTVQGNLGHATAAFTLDRYGHFTEAMQQASAARMERFIKDVLEL